MSASRKKNLFWLHFMCFTLFLDHHQLTENTIEAFVSILSYLAKKESGNKLKSNANYKEVVTRAIGGFDTIHPWEFNMLDARDGSNRGTYKFDFYKHEFVKTASDTKHKVNAMVKHNTNGSEFTNLKGSEKPTNGNKYGFFHYNLNKIYI
jgi:hypothetical protein